MDYNEIEVSFFRNKSDKRPQKVKLLEILKTDHYKELIEAIRNEPDKTKRDKLKSNLPAFTPSAICEGGHAMQHFVSHSGLLFFDFDDKDNHHLENFEDLPNLAKDKPHILYLGKSVSGNGFHAFIPIAEPKKHKEYYRAIFKAFEQCGLIPDKAASDITRLCYVSYDPEAYINPEAEPIFLEEDWNSIGGSEEGLSMGDTLEPDSSITDLYGTYYEAVRMIVKAEMKKAERREELARNPEAESQTELDILHIADDYDEWRNNVANGFALSFGEEMGRPLFHAYSRLSDKYDYGKVEEDFEAACENTKRKLSNGERSSLVTVGSFFHLCSEYGLRSSTIEEDFGKCDLSDFIEEQDTEQSPDDEDL